jgi:fructose-1,6-bisphosphatase I
MNVKTDSTGLPGTRPLVTIQSHILSQQAQFPEATGTLSWVLSAISISAKMIAAQVRRARLEDVLGSLGAQNVQGETQQKLDVIANEILLRNLGGRQGVAVVASEENDEAVILRTENDGETRYCVMFDPLDGSSNLDVAGGVGTIFSILRKDRRSSKIEDSLLQPGLRQVAAGYVMYGSSTVMLLTIGNGVDMFVLDPSIGAVIRVAEGMKIPPKNKCYSLNEGNRLTLPEGYQKYLHWAQEQGYSSRYVGAMVADEPDGLPGGAGRRQGAGRARPAHPRSAAHRDPPAHHGDPGQRRRSGPGRRHPAAISRPGAAPGRAGAVNRVSY